MQLAEALANGLDAQVVYTRMCGTQRTEVRARGGRRPVAETSDIAVSHGVQGVEVENIAKELQEIAEVHVQAAAALSAREYMVAEKLYRTAIDSATRILDPFHTSYVDMLKGLRTCLHVQNKVDEVAKVDLMIAQLCLGQ